jgi:hypothetical protein
MLGFLAGAAARHGAAAPPVAMIMETAKTEVRKYLIGKRAFW